VRSYSELREKEMCWCQHDKKPGLGMVLWLRIEAQSRTRSQPSFLLFSIIQWCTASTDGKPIGLVFWRCPFTYRIWHIKIDLNKFGTARQFGTEFVTETVTRQIILNFSPGGWNLLEHRPQTLPLGLNIEPSRNHCAQVRCIELAKYPASIDNIR